MNIPEFVWQQHGNGEQAYKRFLRLPIGDSNMASEL